MIEKLVDERNSDLWNLLNDKFDISIDKSDNREYGVYVKGNKAIIYIDYKNICSNSFTHELLHIYLSHKEFYLSSSLKLTIAQNATLGRLLSYNLLEHIGNCLEHLKMFEIYNSLGFIEDKFLLDYDDFKCNDNELNELKKYYRIGGTINFSVVDFYIGKLVAILCDTNKKHNYTFVLKTLQELDNNLFNIVLSLVERTKKYDLENKDIFVSYRDISTSFYEELVDWLKSNQIA
ncbi:hypothetical protein EV144_1011180 [Flavobacterium sp. 270]|uniref:hypothetical protein n=1 Tax=Flavobacterium sp. 270 TaxID=2512114 RepID=UPI001065D4ED|nr:hypothetical protein [Flavobacterium sp. 270]TDW52490.1 hypothetical protein EV144_1011180 [Flavobacterium sp. 270]